MTEAAATRRLLFVCLGNICRSPLAEGIFLDMAAKRGLADRYRVDSCGLGSWHAGDRADPRSIAVAARHGIELQSRARELDPPRDREGWDLVLAMDRRNRAGLISAGIPEDRVRLLRSFDPGMQGRDDAELDVPDPYLGGPEGFDEVYNMLTRACAGLLDVITVSRDPA